METGLGGGVPKEVKTKVNISKGRGVVNWFG
jgi:hypothetical protein